MRSISASSSELHESLDELDDWLLLEDESASGGAPGLNISSKALSVQLRKAGTLSFLPLSLRVPRGDDNAVERVHNLDNPILADSSDVRSGNRAAIGCMCSAASGHRSVVQCVSVVVLSAVACQSEMPCRPGYPTNTECQNYC